MTTTSSNGNDLVSEILRDHEEIKRLFAALKAADDHDDRDRAFGDLMMKLAVHETAEQEVLHPITRGETEATDIHIHQEKSAEKLLSRLEKMGVDDDDFDAALAELEKDVLAHADSEERTELPLVTERVERDQLEAMGTLFRAAEGAAPTRPHPMSPTSAVGNAVVGPLVAITDRLRDALRANRG